MTHPRRAGRLDERAVAAVTSLLIAALPAAATDARTAPDLWSLRPLADPSPPAPADQDWPENALDAFLLAKLEANGLRPAAPAGRRVLLRRATLDLTGLPPTAEEVAAFAADDSPASFAGVVDRLLGSPRYGERWGRHWLDVARYADSNGLDENIAHGNAWRYRDYVIGAFNRDLPYDQFLVEQIAGDLLDPTPDAAAQRERLIATGFLSLGPKVLAEVDERKMEMDIVDEQVDTVGRALLGLTLGCARCHDHKFDPISTEDYHALAGIFKSTRTMEHFKKIARWHEASLAGPEDLARKSAHDERIAELKTAIEVLVKKGKEHAAPAGSAAKASPPDGEGGFPADIAAELKSRREELKLAESSAPEMPSAMGVTEGEPCDLPIHVRGSHLDLGKVVPRGFPGAFASLAAPPPAGKGSGRLELARWLVNPDHPLVSRVMVNRVWRWHFGRGLVPSVDNFGRLGEAPVNSALLDWLARRFVEGGWSVKKLHRLILTSRTYAQGAAGDPRGLAIDPDNRLLWRFPVRRLEAEALRDSLLAASGLLDLTMGGSLLHVKNREFFFDHTSRDTTRYDSLRRSVYLPVVRNHLHDMFQLFDFTDATVANGDRAATTVASQALFFLNSDLVAKAAERIAGAVVESTPAAGSSRVETLYRHVHSRPPSAAEIALAAKLVAGAEGELLAAQPDGDAATRTVKAWAELAQALLSSNELVHVE